jgi:hypothetical protein
VRGLSACREMRESWGRKKRIRNRANVGSLDFGPIVFSTN